METLPDFSDRKLQIKNRIDGAIRDRKRRSISKRYEILSLLFVAALFGGLYFKDLIFSDKYVINGELEYYGLELIMETEEFKGETTIDLPRTVDLTSALDSSLILVNSTNGKYE